MIIEVSRHAISAGIRSSPMNCPVALALSKYLGKTISVEPFEGEFCWREAYSATKHRLPKEAVDFIRAFDAGKDVAPITFDVC